MANGALTGLTVVDASNSISGQMCARLFADNGAQVVLAEPPGGTPIRNEGKGYLFWHLNTGKDAVTIADITALVALCRGACVAVVSNQAEADQLESTIPGLLVVCIQPFGQEGPYADWLATEIVYQALSGSMYVNGHSDREPLYGVGNRASYAAALWAYVGALAALHRSNRTGRSAPGTVEITVHEAAVAMEQCFSTQWAQTGVNQTRGNQNRPKGMVKSRDGWLVYFVMPGHWPDFCGVFDAPELKADPRFSTWSNLVTNWAEATQEIQTRAAGMTTAEIDQRGIRAGVPLAPYLTPRQVWSETQYGSRSFWQNVETPYGNRTSLGPVFRLSKAPAKRHLPAPSDPASTASPFSQPNRTYDTPDDELPLSDLRVVDLTSAWAGPMAARILGFLGAAVIKVEGVNRPDGWRGPAANPPIREFYPNREPGDEPMNRNTWFNSQNLDKRGVRIDLKDRRGSDLLKTLASKSDVVIANTRPGVLERLGIDYPRLLSVNDQLIGVEMPAFGTGGPRSTQAALGPTMEALTGFGALIGYDDGAPVGSGSAYLDPIGALHGAAAVLTALIHRDRERAGQYVEVAQCEAAMHWIGELILEAEGEGTDFAAIGNSSRVHSPHGAYPAVGADEWLVIAIETEQQWQALSRLLGREDLGDLGAEERVARRSEIDALISEWTKSHDKHRLAELLQKEGIAAAPVATGQDLCEDPQLAAADWFTEIDQAAAGPQQYPRLPFRLNGKWWHHRAPSPQFGEHTCHVLTELCDLSQEAIEEMTRAGVIA